MAQSPRGLRVLIVEDETMIAMLLESMITDLGHEVAAMAGHKEDAMEAIQTVAFDIAILDVNLAGERSYRIADALIERDIPFVFSTGYGEGSIEGPYRDQPILNKPFRKRELGEALSTLSSKLAPR